MGYACSTSTGESAAGAISPTDPGSGANGGPGSGGGETGGQPGTQPGGGNGNGNGNADPNVNPIDGIGQPALYTDAQWGGYADGPAWKDGALYFSDYYGGIIYKCTAANACTTARTLATGLQAQGTTFDDKANAFITAEVDPNGTNPAVINRWPLNGGAPTAVTPTFPASTKWDGPNDIVVRSDGTVYVTDPAYQSGGVANHVWSIKPAGAATSVVDTSNGEHPNGIALSKDEKTLFVSFTDSAGGPSILKYPTNADGTLGASSRFASVAAGSDLDGIAVDEAGNVYASTNTGIEVFKADGMKWGRIALTKAATNVAFGGMDRKTLYITANGAVYEVTGLKVAGVAK